MFIILRPSYDNYFKNISENLQTQILKTLKIIYWNNGYNCILYDTAVS